MVVIIVYIQIFCVVEEYGFVFERFFGCLWYKIFMGQYYRINYNFWWLVFCFMILIELICFCLKLGLYEQICLICLLQDFSFKIVCVVVFKGINLVKKDIFGLR